MNALDSWEALWAPYDETTYLAALSYVRPNDVVLDIGAGDLRFSLQTAKIARRVYAIEQQPQLLAGHPGLPLNLTVLCADARAVSWPDGITLAILLMRHCTHVGQYAARLRAMGCRRLVTNARWGMDVELMDLFPRAPWEQITYGWYACLCGQTGFVEAASVETLTETDIWQVTQVETCPACTE